MRIQGSKSIIIASTYIIGVACSDGKLMQPQQVTEENIKSNELAEDDRSSTSASTTPTTTSSRRTNDKLTESPAEPQDENLASQEPETNSSSSLPKSGSNTMDMNDEGNEDVLAPILINGAALTCQIGEPETLYCLLDKPDMQSYTWKIFNGDEELMETSLYNVYEIEGGSHWNVKINTLESFASLRAEASIMSTNSEGVMENHVHSSKLFNMETSLSIQEQLSIVYESSEYGDLTLTVNSNNEVTGSWQYDDVTGDLTGIFSPESMSIQGRWIERVLNSETFEGDYTFEFTLSPEGVITVNGQYTNDGSSGTSPWPLSPKPE